MAHQVTRSMVGKIVDIKWKVETRSRKMMRLPSWKP